MDQSPPQPKFWKEMYINLDHPTQTTSSGTDQQIISDKPPIDFSQKYENLDWECIYPFTPQKCNEVSPSVIEFLHHNNQMHTGLYERVDKSLLSSLTGLDTYLFLLKHNTAKGNKIMGTMIVIIVNTTATSTPDKPNTSFALVSYLCIHKKLRNNGLCMMLIRKALKIVYDKDIICSYYLEAKPFSKSGMQVKRYMRPINVQSAVSHGFEFVMPDPNNKVATKHAYFIGTTLPKPYKYNHITSKSDIDQSLSFITSNNSDKPFSWIPAEQEWTDWCKSPSFDTIVLRSTNNKIQGIITIQKKQVFIPETNCTSSIAFVPYHLVDGSASQQCKEMLLNAAMIHCKTVSPSLDMLFVFESGDLNKDCIESNKFVPTGHMYIDYYNYIPNFSHSLVHVPLL